MDSSLGLTGSEVKVVSGGTLTTEEFSTVTGSGSNSEEKPNNLIEPALFGGTFPHPSASVLVVQASMLVRPVQFEDSSTRVLAESFFVKLYYFVA